MLSPNVNGPWQIPLYFETFFIFVSLPYSMNLSKRKQCKCLRWRRKRLAFDVTHSCCLGVLAATCTLHFFSSAWKQGRKFASPTSPWLLQASAMSAHLSFLINHVELQRCDLSSTKLSTSNVWANSFKITPLVTPGEHTGASPQGLCLQFVGIIW